MSRRERPHRLACESGQATILMLGLVAAGIAFALVLAAFGQAYGARARSQRVADLAAIAAAEAMRDAYPRLFEPPLLRPGVPNPRHLSRAAYLALARAAAERGARRNGGSSATLDVRFPGADSFAPTRVAVRVRDRASVRVSREGREAHVPVRAHATAELSPGAGAMPAFGSGEYDGPLAYRQGKPMRPDVAQAFDRMERAAAAAGVQLIVNSGYRSNAEQAILFARHPDPRWVARPGTSLHRLGTELDLGPNAAYGWLARNATRFGFMQRYSWEPWHYGYTRNTGSSSVGFGARGGDGRATRAVQSFVPARYAPLLARAAQRWQVSAQLLAAQIYAESNFNPFAVSPAGAQGIAQFMPGTAAGLGLRDPFDAPSAIDAQAHLMHDLLSRFGSVPLALAAYNAGPGAVAACGCVPPYAETQAYVAKIVGLLGGAGDLGAAGGGLEVRLVE
jgi:soluble lytic murein transglycosylase-like protein